MVWKISKGFRIFFKGFCNHALKGYLQTKPRKGVPVKVVLKICSMQQNYRRTFMPKCDFNKFAKQLHWNHTSAWVFSCKFAAYFHNNFSQEHLWVAASGPPVCFLVSFLKFFGGERQTNKQTNKLTTKSSRLIYELHSFLWA